MAEGLECASVGGGFGRHDDCSGGGCGGSVGVEGVPPAQRLLRLCSVKVIFSFLTNSSTVCFRPCS